jgi:hypothetical protein
MNRIENFQHPISLEKNPRIDIFFGKRQHEAAEDMMVLMHQTLPTMERGETILVINSLCVHDDLARSVDRVAKGKPGKVHVYSASGVKLREKLEFLSLLISQKRVRMLVVNSFEFAACGSRQKHALAHWLREMRDAHKLRVIVYSCARECPKFGALADLSFVANSTDEVGEWRWHNNYQNGSFGINATEMAVRYADAVEKLAKEMREKNAEGKSDEKAGEKSQGMTMPRREWHGKLNFIGPDQLIESLKNKNLATVSAGLEEESELAMAA